REVALLVQIDIAQSKIPLDGGVALEVPHRLPFVLIRQKDRLPEQRAVGMVETLAPFGPRPAVENVARAKCLVRFALDRPRREPDGAAAVPGAPGLAVFFPLL